MKITILGCYAATPRTISNPTAQVLEMSNRVFLIDCGEGTQIQLRRNKIKFSKINHIFISHLHGDHFYGLIGLISTFMLLNRKSDLHIYGPKGIKEIILLQLRYSESFTGYNLYFHELTHTTSNVIYEDDKILVKNIPLDHRIYTNGYLFVEKPKERKINSDKTREYRLESYHFHRLKKGKDVVLEDGTIVKNEWVTLDPEPPKSYAFCSDTVYNEQVAEYVKGVTVLYHEATFLESESRLAERTKHSTARQAALIAQQAVVDHLILGHFSTRYDTLDLFLEEAHKEFTNTYLADDNKVFEF